MSFLKFQPKYVSLNITHDDSSKIDTPIEAIIQQNYDSPVLKDTSKFYCAIERLEISSNCIPFYNAVKKENDYQNEEITIRSRTDTSLTTATLVSKSCYSLTELLGYLNSLTYENPNNNVDFNLFYSITGEGFISLKVITPASGIATDFDFSKFQIEFPYYLNAVLGISVDVQLDGQQFCTSKFPRIDCGDDFNHIVLSSNLQTISDVIGQAQTNVLTDLAPSTSFSASFSYANDTRLYYNGISTAGRQKIIYLPNERRYLELISPFALNYIRIEANYVDNYGNTNRILLPFGGSFFIKLGFYKKE